MSFWNRKKTLLLFSRQSVREGAAAIASAAVVILLILFLNANQSWFRQENSEKSNGIDTSAFTDPSVKNNTDLVLYAKQAADNRWGYVYGTCGQVLNPSLLSSRREAYPDEITPYQNFIEANWMGRRVTDCAGLIKGYGWLNPENGTISYGTNGIPDLSANGMYEASAEKGGMGTLPELPGIAVWMNGHIGVYEGKGDVIEAMTTTRGVVKTRLQGRGWRAWLKVPGIRYTGT